MIGRTPDNNDILDTEVIVPFNFWRSLDFPLDFS